MIFLHNLIVLIFLLLSVLVSVAFVTLLERKILSLVGLRLGPNKVSLTGLMQPVMDAVKLVNKQQNYLSNFSLFYYYASSSILLMGSFILWTCIPFTPPIISLKFSVLILMVVMGVNSLSSIISGWSTFGKYSLIGSVRSVVQLISYEASLYLLFLFFSFLFLAFNFNTFLAFMATASIFFYPVCFYIWVPSVLAELNRTPYDFSEGESELVSGFNTEFGSSSFTLLFLAEYSNIVFFSVLSSFLFFFSYYLVVMFIFLFFVIWIRSVLPRFRFDKLMFLAWKFFIPFLTFYFLFFVCYSLFLVYSVVFNY